jgi:hypothetical protein
MPKPYAAASLPVGTVLLYDGDRYTKVKPSKHEPWPWLAEYGTWYGDEGASRATADGAEIKES